MAKNGVKIKLHNVKVEDDFATQEGMRIVSDDMKIAEMLALEYRRSKGLPEDPLKVDRGMSIDEGNWGYQYYVNSVPGFYEWTHMAPRSITMEACYDPENAVLPSGQLFGDKAKLLISNAADAIGVRARAKVVKNLLLEDIKIDENWLVLASGGAVPSLTAYMDAPCKPKSLVLVDFDTKSLRRARAKSKKLGIRKSVRITSRNLLTKSGFKKERIIVKLVAALKFKQIPITFNKKLKYDFYDRVEITGFMEYLGDEKAARFIKESYRHLKPGGVMVIANSWHAHPQIGFNQGIMQWPKMNFRTKEDFERVIDMSGIKTDGVDGYVLDNQVYTVFRIRKP